MINTITGRTSRCCYSNRAANRLLRCCRRLPTNCLIRSHRQRRTFAIPTCSQPLGAAIPTDEHACSVSLPTWSSVVGYEEGHAHVTNALSTGYPRFVYHSYVVQLMQAVVERHGNTAKEDCLLLPTAGAALRCQAFLRQCLRVVPPTDTTPSTNPTNSILQPQNDTAWLHADSLPPSSSDTDSQTIRAVTVTDHVYAVVFPAQTAYGVAAKAYWQHTGEVVSSRRAAAALQCLNIPIQRYVTDCQSVEHPCVCDDNGDTTQDDRYESASPAVADEMSNADPHGTLRHRIANDWIGPSTDVTSDHVFLAPSGMAAIYGALRSARRYHHEQQQVASNSSAATIGGTSIVYGFPYLDTLKMCSRPELCPAGVEFFGRGDAQDLEDLERLLEASANVAGKSYSVLFTEVPSNPLLQCPDVVHLRTLADRYNFVLVVDDTISNFLNVDVLTNGLADAVCSSLTKLVSGRGDAIAGSIVTNPYTAKGRWMQQDLQARAEQSSTSNDALWAPDAAAIVENATDFVQRNATINRTSQLLAEWLQAQPDVATVYYPSLPLDSQENHMTPLLRSGAGYGGVVSILLDSHVCQRSFFDALNVAKGPSLGTNFTLVCPYTLLAHYHELDFAMSYNVPPNLLRIAVGLEPFEELRDKFTVALESSRLYPKLSMPASVDESSSALHRPQ